MTAGLLSLRKVVHRKIKFPSKIDAFEMGGTNMSQDVMFDVAPLRLLPSVEHLLHMVCHPGHRDVAQQRQGSRYCGKFFAPATTGRGDVSVVNRTQESMGGLPAIQDA